MKKITLKVLSLFAGAGGMDLGFKNAGYEIIWANDFDADSVKTYKRNLGDHIVLGDIEKIKTNNMPDNPDVVIGGFPCQGFSIANLSRNVDDSRNKLYKQMLRVIRVKKPKYFVAENVSGILTLGKGAVIQKIVKDFKSIGYKVDYKLLNAADYGVPQSRKRVIIIGNRLGLENIKLLKQTFPDIVIGSSDHFNGILSGPVAFMQGARVFEKHVTLDRSSKGTDHSFALEREGFRKFVRDIKRVEQMLSPKADSEIGNEDVFKKLGKSLIAYKDIDKGEVFTLNNLSGRIFKDQIIPVRESNKVIGKFSKRNLKKGDIISYDDL